MEGSGHQRWRGGRLGESKRSGSQGWDGGRRGTGDWVWVAGQGWERNCQGQGWAEIQNWMQGRRVRRGTGWDREAKHGDSSVSKIFGFEGEPAASGSGGANGGEAGFPLLGRGLLPAAQASRPRRRGGGGSPYRSCTASTSSQLSSASRPSLL